MSLPPRARSNTDGEGPRELASATPPREIAARAAVLLSQQRDAHAAAAALLESVAAIFGGKAWLAVWDGEAETASWLPEGAPGPVSLRTAGQEATPLHDALLEGRETILGRGGSGAPPHGAAAPDRAFLPLAAMGQVAGCLILEGQRQDFTPETMVALRCLLPPAALALRAGLLQREMEARVETRTAELSLLYDLSRSLGFVLSDEDLFDLLSTSLRRAIPFDLCALTLLLPGDPRTSVHAAAPVHPDAPRRLQRMAMKEIAALTGRRPPRIRLEHDAAPGEPGRGPELRSAAHVPLHIRGELVGLLSIASRELPAFGEGSVRLLRTVSDQVSLTLDRLHMAREAEAVKIRSMLESMADGVLLLDGRLRIVLSNPAAGRHLATLCGGRPPRALSQIGETPLEPFLEDGQEPPGGLPRSFEAMAHAEGRVFSVTCSPVKGLSSEVRGLVVVLSDITEARRLQMQFAQSEKLSALGEMISGVAHELNNPLASVMGLAQRLQDLPVGEDVRRKLATIDAEASRCRRIVQNLLRFARSHPPERRALDLNGAFESVLQLLGHQLSVDNVVVERRLDPALHPVMGDVHLLQQVFLNIVYNAYQAMKDCRGSGRLVVSTRNEADRVVAEIADDGPGIPPENIKRIFDPFFSTKEVGKGTGLGLSLAYGTIQEHGGTIGVSSRVGAGTVFTIELPSAPRGQVAETPPAPAPQPGLGAHPAPSRAGRILLVEDEPALAEVVAEVLTAAGHSVDVAHDGCTARALLGEDRYDVIISDLKMPNMNGRELYHHVASCRPSLARRIIFSTGDTANPDTQAFFEEVGNHYLSKPFNLADLLGLVEKVLAQA
ncbi:MAG TPA: ATP-binding protein [Candidatus Polarisedimenticolia bacterium]|nr:ATP-binding protein [Candidatus Polarisedimenticolia bacterium]